MRSLTSEETLEEEKVMLMEEELKKQEKAQSAKTTKMVMTSEFAQQSAIKKKEGDLVQSPIQLDSTGAGTLVLDEDLVEVKP